MIYLASISTDNCGIENRAYKSIGNALEYIYNSLKKLTSDIIEDCSFFDRDYVKNYFTEEYFNRFSKVNCHSIYGEHIIDKVKDNKYQFVFIPSREHLKCDIRKDIFIVCELEMLELLD
jgi:hypothetical protein